VRATEIAWAAGLFDGEGHIGLRRQEKGARVYFQRAMGMTNTDLALLQRFQAAVGDGRIGSPWEPPELKHSTKWQWQLTGRQRIEGVFGLLEPFLSQAKGEAGLVVLEGRPPEDLPLVD
jgi:hypothetical protein